MNQKGNQNANSQVLRKRLIQEKRNLLEFFEKLPNNIPALTGANSQRLLSKTLRLCNVEVTQQNFEQLHAQFTEVARSFVDDLTSLDISFEIFWKIAKAWLRVANIPIENKEKVTGFDFSSTNGRNKKVFDDMTQQEIEKFQKICIQAPEMSEYANMIINCLQKQLQVSKRRHSRSNTVSQVRIKNSRVEELLQEQFEFYAVQHQGFGRNPAFEDVTKLKKIMDIGSFLRFCKDHKIYTEEKRHTKRFLVKQDVVRIFKSNAQYSRELSFTQFLQALDILAQEYFNEDYEDMHPFEYVAKQTNTQKRQLLYKMMKLGDTKYQKQIRKSFEQPFHDRSKSRIPPDDPGLNYKFRRSLNIKNQMRLYPGDRKSRTDIKQLQLSQERYDKALAEKRRLRNRDVMKLSDLSQVSYRQIKCDESELMDLIGNESSDEQDVYHF